MFNLELENYGTMTVARFTGDMILENAVEIRRQLEKIILTEKVNTLALDLEIVDNIDNSGLGALVASITTAQAWGKRLMIYRPSDKMVKHLDDAELMEFFPILENEDDLLAHIPE